MAWILLSDRNNKNLERNKKVMKLVNSIWSQNKQPMKFHMYSLVVNGKFSVQPPSGLSNDQISKQVSSRLNLFERYPLTWQGILQLKQQKVDIQMQYVLGDLNLARSVLTLINNKNGEPCMNIAERLTLDQVAVRLRAEKLIDKQHCVFLVLPCGNDRIDVARQFFFMRRAIIDYLHSKDSIGIVKVKLPGFTRPGHVILLFSPCRLSNGLLARFAPDLFKIFRSTYHLMAVVTPVIAGVGAA